MKPQRRIVLAAYGPCPGVDRAIAMVVEYLSLYERVYVLHEIVHNRFWVNDLRGRGAIFVDSIDNVPDGETVIISAHGAGPRTRQAAERGDKRILDASCVNVAKVQEQIDRIRGGTEVVVIGKAGHPEVEGYLDRGRAIRLVSEIEDISRLRIPQKRDVFYVVQTTYNMEKAKGIISALEKRFRRCTGLNTVCKATSGRQGLVRKLIYDLPDMVVVAGSKHSSNSVELREIAGERAILLDAPEELLRDQMWLEFIGGLSSDDSILIYVVSGVSAPPFLVREIGNAISELLPGSVVEDRGPSEPKLCPVS